MDNKKLHKVINARGMSVAEVARKMEMHRVTLSRRISDINTLTVGNLKELAKILSYDYIELLKIIDE